MAALLQAILLLLLAAHLAVTSAFGPGLPANPLSPLQSTNHHWDSLEETTNQVLSPDDLLEDKEQDVEDLEVHLKDMPSGDYDNIPEDVSLWSKKYFKITFMRDQELLPPAPPPAPEDSPPNPPQFMLDLYEKFSRDTTSHPMANIVRSFVLVDNEREKRSPLAHLTPSVVHYLTFNLTSIKPHETVVLAELRLYSIVAAQHSYTKMDSAMISLYERSHDQSSRRMIGYKKVSRSQSGWVAFNVTRAVHRWARTRSYTQTIEVHVEAGRSSPSIEPMAMYSDLNIDLITTSLDDHQPLLVVFSDDHKRKKLQLHELHQLIQQELGQVDVTSDGDMSAYLKQLLEKVKLYKRDTLHVQDSINNKALFPRSNSSFMPTLYELTSNSSSHDLESMYSDIFDVPIHDSPLTLSRHKRSEKPRQRRFREACGRRSMVIKFADIGWNNWIIQPTQYDAYQCVGRCYFPLDDRLSPTKHAIIQALLHVYKPEVAQRACCVPTQLDPISILYLDDQNVITFKYRYEGMVVKTCGCR